MYFKKNMDEISTILKHEEDNKNKLLSADESVKEELDRKRKELEEKLQKESVLTEPEKAGILSRKEQEIEEIENQSKRDLSVKTQELNESKEKNMEKVVDYIVKNSFKN